MRGLLAGMLIAVFIGSGDASSQEYVVSPVTTLVRECSSSETEKFTACVHFVMAISDVYVLNNPQCTYPDAQTFMTVAITSVKQRILATPPSNYRRVAAASFVYDALSSSFPCVGSAPQTVAPQANVPDPGTCQEGISMLGSEFLNSYQKQAMLEMLRNKGCLGAN